MWVNILNVHLSVVRVIDVCMCSSAASVTLSEPVKTVLAKPTSTSTQPVKIHAQTEQPTSTVFSLILIVSCFSSVSASSVNSCLRQMLLYMNLPTTKKSYVCVFCLNTCLYFLASHFVTYFHVRFYVCMYVCVYVCWAFITHRFLQPKQYFA